MFMAEDAYARRAEHEETPFRRSKAEPARRQPQNMAAGKHDRLVISCAKAAYDAIGAGADLRWLLTVRAPVAEQEPAGSVRKDFAGLATLLVAVVPFEQVGIKFGGVAEPSECAGASRTLKGTGHGGVRPEHLPRGFSALVQIPHDLHDALGLSLLRRDKSLGLPPLMLGALVRGRRQPSRILWAPCLRDSDEDNFAAGVVMARVGHVSAYRTR